MRSAWWSIDWSFTDVKNHRTGEAWGWVAAVLYWPEYKNQIAPPIKITTIRITNDQIFIVLSLLRLPGVPHLTDPIGSRNSLAAVAHLNTIERIQIEDLIDIMRVVR